MVTGIAALRRAGYCVTAMLVLFCCAFAGSLPDLLQASEPAHACCRSKHSCICHRSSSLRGLALSATPSCSRDCGQFTQARPSFDRPISISYHHIAQLPAGSTYLARPVLWVETQYNRSLRQRPPPHNPSEV